MRMGHHLRLYRRSSSELLTGNGALPPAIDIDRGKAALTDLFEEAKNRETPIMVRRVVDDIDEIVRVVRFDGWQPAQTKPLQHEDDRHRPRCEVDLQRTQRRIVKG